MAEVSGEGLNFCVSFADCNAQSSRAERTGVLRQSQVQNIKVFAGPLFYCATDDGSIKVTE